MKKITSACVAILVLATPFAAPAQNAPVAASLSAVGPGNAAAVEAVQLQGKVKSIDRKLRTVVLVGAMGVDLHFVVGENARNFDQIRVGDLVTMTYAQALALKLVKVDNNGIRERIESQQVVRAKEGEKPGGAVERSVRVIANVVAVNPKTSTVTLRGAKRTMELLVSDPSQLREIKVGNQVEAEYIEAVALEVTPSAK